MVQYIIEALYAKDRGLFGQLDSGEDTSESVISNLVKVFVNGWILCLWCSQIQCGHKAYAAHIELCHSSQ